MRLFILFLFVSILSGSLVSNSANGQCTISNLQVQTGDCAENGHYNFTLNFFISESPGESFDVFVNGQFLSTHHLNERPLTITNFQGNSSGLDTLTVCASGSESCCATKVMQNPCPCSYFNISTTTVNCTADSMWFELDFDHINIPDSFHLGTVGFYLGLFDKNDLPVMAGPIPRTLLPAEILISDTDFFCFEYFDLTDEDCDSCLIYNVNAVAGACDEDGFFPVSLTFRHRNTGNNGFTIHGNGADYGLFTYSNDIIDDNGLFVQSVDLGILPGDCETIWEFVVKDADNNECSDFSVLQPICCINEECAVGPITITELECTSVETIQFMLNFEYENAGNNSFDLYLNDYHVGYYPLGSLPLFIEELQFYPNDENVLKVCINDQMDCCNTYVFENLDCFEAFCELGSVGHSIIFTNQEVFYVQLDFSYNNTGDQGFNIRGNGKNYGNFFYESLPVLVGPFNCRDNIPLEFGIRDVEYNECKTVLELGIIPCETNTADLALQGLKLLHSPIRHTITLQDETGAMISPQFRIVNALGQMISVQNINSYQRQIEFSTDQLTAGIYFLQIIDQGRNKSFKFIISQ